MLAWIIQISLISLIFIFLVHHLIGFFKTTLTVPKIRDLVNSPSQKYKNIFDTINTNMSMSTISLTDSNSNSNSYTAIDLLPSSSSSSSSQTYTSPSLDDSTKDMMKDELKSFLKKQLNTNDSNSTFPTNNSFQNNSYFSQ
jgi:hypothetical protein